MIKKLAAAALLAATFAGASAQETLYLVKGNEVVAKYSTEEVDYACFTLPPGVVDRTDGNQVSWTTGSASYYGTENDYSVFQLRFTNSDILDESFPQRHMYIQFTAPMADYSDLHLFEGSYTLGDPQNPQPYKYYEGIRVPGDQGEGIMGTFLVDLNGPDDMEVTIITGGSFDIRRDGNDYVITGLMKDEKGNVIDFSYEGYCHISNESDEKGPADELPLPASRLTGDVDFTVIPSDAYCTVYGDGTMFADNPNLDYIWLMLYGDRDYASCLDVALVVDRAKYPGVKLPKGTYPIVKREGDNYATVELGAVPAFSVLGEANIANYGCWLSEDYNPNALVAGEVEVLEDSDLRNVNIKVTLYDNADTPHKVTCTYKGKLTTF